MLTDISFDGGSIELTRAICGRVEATARGTERSAFSYDGLMPIREERSGAATATLAWTYNSDLVPSSFTYAGATQSYGYDVDGLLASAAPFTIGRRTDNGLATSVSAPGFSLARSFNPYGEIDSAGTGAYTYELIRDAAGRITGKTETTAGQTREWGYSYDSLGRLTRATLDGELAESYAYDPQGNRTAYRAPARGIESTVTNTFDAEDRLMSSGDASFTYTADGFVASKDTTEGTTSYAYSGLGELLSVDLPDGRVVTYSYDASGRRTSKALDGTVTERYMWADATRLLAIYDGAGTQLYRFLYADSRVPFAADTPDGRIFFSYDQVGSLRAVTDASGAVLETRAHDSFGNVIGSSAPAKRSPLGFAGGLTDADTGLVLFGARDYDTALGRWLAKDPIGFAGGDVNLYGYCLGDPVGLVDPSGLFANPRDTVSDKDPANAEIVREFMKDAAPAAPSALDKIYRWWDSLLNLFDWSGTECSVGDASESANRIASGHAFQKHILEESQFPEIATRTDFAQYIGSTILDPSATKLLPRNRIAYWNVNSRLLVIVDPNSQDGGSAFKSTQAYFDGLESR